MRAYEQGENARTLMQEDEMARGVTMLQKANVSFIFIDIFTKDFSPERKYTFHYSNIQLR